MTEIITAPLDYYTSKHYLIKILKFIQKYGYTTDKSSLHINLSFKDKPIEKLNIIKQIVTTNESEIYKIFPSRKNNIYAKSIKKIIPFKDYDFSNISIETICNSVRLPNDKYYGINFTHITNPNETKRIEFRYIGGEKYENYLGDIIEIMDKFIINTYNNISSTLDSKNIEELSSYLSTKINTFKSFETYDNFLVEFPKISLQIDQQNNYDLINSYYQNIHKKLYEFIESVDELSECIINFNTELQKLEIVNAKFKTLFVLNEYEFINCDVMDAIIENSIFYNCKINNAHLTKCNIELTDIYSSKIFNCSVDRGDIIDSYFEGGRLNANMKGGIFRSGKKEPFAYISPETSVVTDGIDNFFNTKPDDDDKKDTKK